MTGFVIIVCCSCVRRAGIPFVAVHDSFWTHACFVDEMKEVRSSSFVCASCFYLICVCRLFLPVILIDL